jgi:predicted dehydrogenase
MPEVRIVAVVDNDFERAKLAAGWYNAEAYADIESALANPEVEIIHLCTPPYLHAPQGIAAMSAGKHLFCEKPLALTIAAGEEMIWASEENDVRMTVNYVMRYNPFWTAAAELARSGVLGRLRHLDLANHAAGLNLPANHWFWRPELSGGIWIEHGVHFFDAFDWVADEPGEVLSSHSYHREDGAADRVEALFYYGDVAAHCYHAFDKSGQTERTTVRLTFDEGYVTLEEWVPASLELLTRVDWNVWESYLPGVVVEADTVADGKTLTRAYAPEGKSALYRRSIQDGMRNLVRAAQNPDVPLRVTGDDALRSLKVAVDAQAKSQS